MNGTVIRNTGSHYIIETPDGSQVPCKAKGNFRIRGIRTTNPVAVGDHVEISDPGPDGTAYIIAISPRDNYIIRRASNLSKESHIIAANLQQAALVASLAHPTTSTTFIDRFLATAEAYSVRPLIIINKIDLLTDDDSRGYLDAFTYLYTSIGYPVIHLSATLGDGLAALIEALKDKVTLLTGNSGVGKSTIVNDLIPDADVRTAAISEAHDQGTHTTTFSQLYHLPGGGDIIDTPGIRGFGTIDFDRAEVAHFFPEIFKMSQQCRFANCTHTHEPGCAVRQAVADSLIAQSRYTSYTSILDDTAEDKYRK